MLDKFEEMLDNPLVCAIAKGLTLAMAILFAVLTLVALIATAFSAWRILALILCGILTGISAGLAYYLWEEF